MNVGDNASKTTTITSAMIEQFATATGDRNPVHLDEEYAAGTIFKQRIAHGFLTGGLISAVIANQLPGEGAIYMSQSMSFKAPVYIGDAITAQVVVTKYREDKRIVTLETTCTNQDGTVVLEGEAVVKAPK